MMKYILILFLFTFNLYAADIRLFSVDPTEIKRGDLVNFKVEGDISENDLKQYENKRIGELVYLVKVFKQKDELYVEGLISERGIKEELPKMKDQFTVYNLNFIPTKKKNIKDFIIVEGPKLKEKLKSKWIIILVCIVIIGLSFIFLRKRQKIKKKKNLFNQKLKIYSDIINSRSVKEKYERIYLLRKELNDFYEFDEKLLTNFITCLDEIQYQKEWPTEYFAKVENTFESFKKSLREKDGV